MVGRRVGSRATVSGGTRADRAGVEAASMRNTICGSPE